MIYVKDAKSDYKWNEVGVGGNILEPGTSLEVNTGDWRIFIPKFFEEHCTQCMLCFPVCADSAIPVKDGKRLDFDFKHCKGCGVCYKVCPKIDKAITWEEEDK
ncbi:MAG: 4Fe-4S binding protein [Defluviitaleaceae bacterium]|nr:4Fe-4S binding protein [Defluviitaleaceae bacterium]